MVSIFTPVSAMRYRASFPGSVSQNTGQAYFFLQFVAKRADERVRHAVENPDLFGLQRFDRLAEPSTVEQVVHNPNISAGATL